MSISDWPALAGFKSPVGPLVSERAIWGKVHGQRSDFRWIARSRNFAGHRSRVERELNIAKKEDRPADIPLWRFFDGRFYAVWCYRSPSSDKATRTDFLEKQILEWAPSHDVPPAAAALMLLAEVSRFSFDSWFSRHADPQWADETHVITDIAPVTIEISEDQVAAAADEAHRFWKQQPLGALAECFAALESGVQPAILGGIDRPVPPVALAALLLPLAPEDARTTSLAGGVPTDRFDDVFGERWNVVVSRSRSSTTRMPSAFAAARAEALHTNDPRSAAGPRPLVARLLKFAESPHRWLPADTTSPAAALSKAEERYLAEAIQGVRADAEVAPAGMPAPLAEARRRHLLFKAGVIEAACHKWFGQPATSPEAASVQKLWDQDLQQRAGKR